MSFCLFFVFVCAFTSVSFCMLCCLCYRYLLPLSTYCVRIAAVSFCITFIRTSGFLVLIFSSFSFLSFLVLLYCLVCCVVFSCPERQHFACFALMHCYCLFYFVSNYVTTYNIPGIFLSSKKEESKRIHVALIWFGKTNGLSYRPKQAVDFVLNYMSI